MAAIRRHPGLFGTVGAVLVMLAAVWLLWTPRWSAHADQNPQPLDPVTAAQVSSLRQAAGLDDDALAAANLSDAQLDTLLGALRTWYTNNANTWNSLCASITNEQLLIAQCQSAIANGQDQAQQLASHQQQLAQLLADAQNLLADLRQNTLPGLADRQRAAVNQMRANPDLTMPFRMLNLTVDQRQQLSAARTTYLQGLAVAPDDPTRQNLADTYTQNLTRALGNDNLQTINRLGSYLPDASSRVLNALTRNLPIQDGT
jgi:hypothetical protein